MRGSVFPNPPSLRPGFSLIEVIAAVGIFAIGMVGVLALFAPVTKSVVNVGEVEAAARAADAVRARLLAMPFDSARALVQDPAAIRTKDADPAYNPNNGARYPGVLFGKLNGEIGVYRAAAQGGAAGWYTGNTTGATNPTPMPDADKFFEIDLIRNVNLTPATADDTAPLVAYTIRVRWPAFRPVPGATTAVQIGAGSGGAVTIDNSKKQVMFFAGALSR